MITGHHTFEFFNHWWRSHSAVVFKLVAQKCTGNTGLCGRSSLASGFIGYEPQIDYSFIETNRRLRKQHPEIVASVIQKIESLGASAAWDKNSESLWLNDELRVSIVLCRHITTLARSSRWLNTTGFQPEAGHHHRRSHGCDERGASGIIICCRPLT